MRPISKSVLTLLFFCSFVITAIGEDTPAPIKPLTVTEARNAAVGFALTQATFTDNMIAACSQLSSKGKQDPEIVLSGWRQRNGPYVEAAHGWILYVTGIIRGSQGQEAAETFQSNTLNEFKTMARATADDMFSRGDAKSVVCEKWMLFLSDPRIDLVASTEFGADLRDILTFHRAVLEAARGHVSPNTDPLHDVAAAGNRGDFKTELAILTPLAELGNPDALGNIGNIYVFGKGVEINLATAYSYWLRAAEKHLGTAMFNIASLYTSGQGGLANDQMQAALWYKKAAEHRHEKAMINLSSIYASGRGLEKNRQLAVAWASLAATNAKSEQAKILYQNQLRELVKGMSKEEVAETQKVMGELAKIIDANVAMYMNW
ncbi:MAG: sel1 repeat family protein [Proteobacteria bacterium]|nr:sel1 repeat family protein [Pseudomonadota bacterium]